MFLTDAVALAKHTRALTGDYGCLTSNLCGMICNIVAYEYLQKDPKVHCKKIGTFLMPNLGFPFTVRNGIKHKDVQIFLQPIPIPKVCYRKEVSKRSK